MIIDELRGVYLSEEDVLHMTNQVEVDENDGASDREFETVADFEKMHARYFDAAGLEDC